MTSDPSQMDIKRAESPSRQPATLGMFGSSGPAIAPLRANIQPPPISEVTTYVRTDGAVFMPAQVTDTGHGAEGDSSNIRLRVPRYSPSKKASEGPLARTIIKTLSSEAGRENALQLLQSFLLFLHASLSRRILVPPILSLLGPSPRGKRAKLLRPIYLLSEVIANTRRLFVLGRWGFEGVCNAFAVTAELDKTRSDQNIKEKSQTLQSLKEDIAEPSSASSEEPIDHDAPARSGHAPGRPRAARQKSMFGVYRQAFDIMTRILGTASEFCDLIAFLGGTSSAWRTRSRRRYGLERLSIWLGLLALPPAFALHRLLLARARQDVRDAHAQVLQAIDQADDPAANDARVAGAQFFTGAGISFPKMPAANASSSRLDLARAEAKLLKAQRQVRTLKWEQRAIFTDATFTVYEALRPDKEKQFVESLSGMLGSMIRIGLLCAA
ncbi:hypothetical protein K437DRAFT_135859 [Tilletiaria anomala UBC 951]|uniref:Uncharacterized protein n=1 Tax=Tilletiaria anomala (strain ATCC 24038 / CBS 436.72 / UBC 951) TaxID=1037660 RepID=A0A066WQW4_TILAU|nr:uncharacterized protein K437DRAFT_135859 [Tilletiaria anomala UBC 951]KDN53035.1 hypothetical protein K437DRAFT_135859 [Tilletiaria anomala UBC 951]